MDYEQKYKDALERMKDIVVVPNTKEALQALKETIFPELAESEDERMIKSMTRLVKAFYDCNFPTPEGFERKDLLAWLEKQKEQKQAESGDSEKPNNHWSEEDDKVTFNLISELCNLSVRGLIKKSTYRKYADWLKSLRPHWKPSEEQMKHLHQVMIGWHPDTADCQALHSLYEDLKKLM